MQMSVTPTTHWVTIKKSLSNMKNVWKLQKNLIHFSARDLGVKCSINVEFEKSAAPPRPTYFGSTPEISRRHDVTSSCVSRLKNLYMIGFGPFVAFRAGTRWAMPIVTAYSFKDASTEFRRVYRRPFRSCLSNIGHTDQFNIKAVTVLDQTVNFNRFRWLERQES